PLPEVAVPRVAGHERSGGLIASRDDLSGRDGPGHSEHPLDVGGDGQSPATAAQVTDTKTGDLERIVERDRLVEFQRDPPGGVLELGESGAVTGDVEVLVPDREGGGPPH